MTDVAHGLRLADALRRHAPGSTVFDDEASASIGSWNGVAGGRPLARIECRAVPDVSAALRIAGDFGVPVSVAGGRLDAFGRNNRDGHLAIDLRRLTKISYDPDASTVTALGGATTGVLLAGLPEGLAAATAANGDVGLVGAASGGGYTLLSGRLGLICDTLRRAEVVLADGSHVVASPTEDAELFWALRGGGSGFGVVTAATFATIELPTVLAATVRLPEESFPRALSMIQAALDEHPLELGIVPFFTREPNGPPVLILAFVWHGRELDGVPVRDGFLALPGAELLAGGQVPYRQTLDNSGLWPWGKHWDCGTRTVSRIDGPLAEKLVGVLADMPDGAVLFLHDFHGAGTVIPADATAFALREEHFVVAMVGRWEPGDDVAADRQRTWIASATERLAAHALPGGYINFLRPDDGERAARFFAGNADRLQAVKRRVDPFDRFDCATGRF